MKTLKFNGEEFKADIIVKTATDIIGYDTNSNEIFAFKGISDFSKFTLEDGQEFDIIKTPEQRILELEQLVADLASLQLGV